MMARISRGASKLGVKVVIPKTTTMQYRVVDIFTTHNGAWEVSGSLYSIPQWARDAYLRREFDDAGADHHLFGMVLNKNGAHVQAATIKFGTPQWGDSNDVVVQVKARSGWANIPLYPSSSFSPERGERGGWVWHPVGNDSEIVTGGGLPNNHHVSTFAVWQEVDDAVVLPPTDDDEGLGQQVAVLQQRVAALEGWARRIQYQ